MVVNGKVVSGQLQEKHIENLSLSDGRRVVHAMWGKETKGKYIRYIGGASCANNVQHLMWVLTCAHILIVRRTKIVKTMRWERVVRFLAVQRGTSRTNVQSIILCRTSAAADAPAAAALNWPQTR